MKANAGLSPHDRENIKAHLEECIAAFEKNRNSLEECDRRLQHQLIEIRAELARLGQKTESAGPGAFSPPPRAPAPAPS